MTNMRKLNRTSAHRISMLRTMVSQLVKHELLKLLLPRRQVDRMLTLGKEGSLCAAKRAAAFVRGDDVIHKLFTELAYRYK
ncbi:putative ribosomal protein L17 [Lupinus albus]|uniref:Putative ribosomal protein L17 n=1 Tax=Lupinus albus TaxID=3870 RepID=A0A6A4PR68_LUPAL|nr:putative ribosomal protein L17 [Lupinus albus]